MLLFLIFISIFSVSKTLKLNYKIPGPRNYDDKIAIVGAGPAGCHMAYLLKKKGYKNIEILESSNRVGGKSYSPTYRGIAHDTGTVYLTPDYNDTIIKLVNQYVPGDMITTIPSAYTLDNFSDKFYSLHEITGIINSKLLNSTNATEIGKVTFGAAYKYIELHKSLFGNYEGELFQEPNVTVKHAIRGTIMDFLKRNDLETLIPMFTATTSVQGYGLLDETPALYGLLWNTPKLVAVGLDPSKDLFMLKSGFQNLWEKIIEKENISVTYNAKIVKMKVISENTNSRNISLTYNSHNKTTNDTVEITKFYNFVMWSPEMQQSLPYWENINKTVKNYFNKTHHSYFAVSIMDTKKEIRSQAPSIWRFTSNNSDFYKNRVTTQRDTFGEINLYSGPLYQNQTYPISADNSNFTTTVNYQMYKTKQNETFLKRIFMDHKKHMNATNITLNELIQWRYFPRYSAEDIESGILWRILEIQGKQGVWYIGSSVCFESVRSVAEYNKVLLENMETEETVSTTSTTTTTATTTTTTSRTTTMTTTTTTIKSTTNSTGLKITFEIYSMLISLYFYFFIV